jgi:crossover junction endodeoxyribonuclease RuvC
VRIRILGIDPGLRITGFGVLDKTGNTLTYVTSGCIKTPAGDLALRLKTILDGLSELIAGEKPDQVALEKVFVNKNPQSTLLLGQARGTAVRGGIAPASGIRIYRARAGGGRRQRPCR